jgi:hypothetical protein
VLLGGLESCAGTCLWLDTDVLVNGDLQFMAAESQETIIVTQDPWEYSEGSTHRFRNWGLVAGRSLPGPLNRAGARVSACHAPLLRSWQALLSTEAYLAQETTPPRQRDQHVLSDQHGLSALLASDEFANLLMRRLLHASEILQHHGAEVSRPKQRWEYRSAEACLRSFILWGRSNQPHPSWIGSREITMSGGIWSFLHMFILLGSTESDYTKRRRGWISTLCLVGWVPS